MTAAPVGIIPPINRTRFQLPPSQYFQQSYPKDLIVLHFTAGTSARSAYETWIQSAVQVATSYLVDVDGAIYELFDPRYWAYHLGIRGVAAANWKHDRRSIGIEVANVGPLRPDAANPQRLNWWPPAGDFKTRYCDSAQAGKYVERPYRGFQHFASFPHRQTQAVVALSEYLCQMFRIPKRLPPPSKRMEFDVGFYSTFQGVASHQNFRDDKTDIGPAWDWQALADAGFH
ncbi:MAG: N-acetylmuramoyl-L-alanine amidase [Bryobacteraceae bacterium]|nr:N-acetylmuramoyl-L-alanine amidase [Bryobacteraceae bacterium]